MDDLILRVWFEGNPEPREPETWICCADLSVVATRFVEESWEEGDRLEQVVCIRDADGTLTKWRVKARMLFDAEPIKAGDEAA